jgi:hypothetical protein
MLFPFYGFGYCLLVTALPLHNQAAPEIYTGSVPNNISIECDAILNRSVQNKFK